MFDSMRLKKKYKDSKKKTAKTVIQGPKEQENESSAYLIAFINASYN